jgi:hypothetical protein
MNGSKINCGICGAVLGKGKGLKTGAEIRNAIVKITDFHVPQLQGLPVRGTLHICIDCATGLANQMHKLQADSIVLSEHHPPAND